MGVGDFLVQPDANETHWVNRSLGARVMYRAPDGHIAIVEHPLTPRGLGSPVHTHGDEDEYSFVIEGTVGIEIAGEVMTAGPGALVVKPRGIPHAFWNAGDSAARVLEIITPAGFEEYFVEMAAARPKDGPPQPEHLKRFGEIAAKYSLSVDRESLGRLVKEHGLAV